MIDRDGGRSEEVLSAYVELLSQADPPDLPPRRTRACRPWCGPRTVDPDALLVRLHSAHTQYRILDSRGEVV
jgi:hypothetical protein